MPLTNAEIQASLSTVVAVQLAGDRYNIPIVAMVIDNLMLKSNFIDLISELSSLY